MNTELENNEPSTFLGWEMKKAHHLMIVIRERERERTTLYSKMVLKPLILMVVELPAEK